MSQLRCLVGAKCIILLQPDLQIVIILSVVLVLPELVESGLAMNLHFMMPICDTFLHQLINLSSRSLRLLAMKWVVWA